nr:retrovirus-related Pol polyprotein from transposon TNT 1-94 [Tanacetum cinerariifolium]
MGQDRQMQMVEGNGRNQSRQYAGQNAGNLAGYNDVIGNQVIQNAVQNPRVQNVGNPNGLMGVQGNGNQNQIGNGNLVAVRAEGNAAGQNGNQIRCYNCRGIGYQNPFYLKQAQKKQQSLYDGKMLLDKHDPPVVHDSEETLQLAQESHDKMKQMNKEINPTNYIKINHLSGVFVPQKALSLEELYFSNNSKTANVSKSFLIPNEDLSDDTTPSVERKFLNEEVAKFVGDFKSLAKEADDSLAKHKAMELDNERLLKAVVSQETEDAKLWNDWYKKCNECKYDKISYDKAYKDMQQKIERLQAQLGDLKGVNNDKVITLGMFRINPSKISRKKHVLNTVSASARTKPITVSQTHGITKKNVNSDLNGLSSTRVDNNKTRRPKPRSNTKHDRVPSASKSSRSKNKADEIEEHHRNLLFSKNNKHISSACNNSKIDSHDVISKVVCDMCKKCLISVNHDKCLRIYANGKIPHGKKQMAKVSVKEIQKNYQPKIAKPNMIGTRESLATPKPSKSRFILRWSPTGKLFDTGGKIVDYSESNRTSDCSNGDNACTSNTMEPKIKRFPNSTSLLGRLSRFVCGTSTQVAFRRDACFIRNLEGVDLLKGDRSTNLYTINLHELASASPICLMAGASSTKSWLWHQRLSHLNFDTIYDLAKNDLIAGLPKFKYHKEHLCPSCEQGKSKRASHPPKPVPNSRQRLHLLYMDLCGPMRIASINGKKYVLVIVDDYSRYTWVHFLRSKDEAPEVIIKTKKIIETINVSFDELSAMAFEQRSSKPGLQSMTSGHISSGLNLTYAPSTIPTQQPSEGELDLLFEAMYDDYFGGQPSATGRSVSPVQEPQVCQTSTTSTTITDIASLPTNSSSHATNILITSQDVDELNLNAMV